MRTPCPKCGRVHPSNMARAQIRFTPNAKLTFQAAYPDAPLRDTRGEAENDQCHRWWLERRNR